MDLAATPWDRDNAISQLNAAGYTPTSTYLSDIHMWLITTEDQPVHSIAREPDIVTWAEDRAIFDTATPMSQFSKTQEEVDELGDAIATNNKHETKDAIGDIAVTLVLQAHMHGWTLGECLESAYQTIKNRKGRMVDGVFVKEA